MNSCISTQKYADYVNKKYNQKVNTTSFVANDYIEFDTTNFKNASNIVQTEKIKSLFIPALFYWQWNNSIKCTFSSQQSLGPFYNNFQHFADSLKFNEKLKGQRLVIQLESIPRTFVYTNKGFVIFAIVAYSTTGIEAIFPENQNLIFSYKIYNGASETKAGRIEINNTDGPLKNIWKSTKKFTWLYVDQYENNLKRLIKSACKKLENELLTGG
jgi:hypothetical protein